MGAFFTNLQIRDVSTKVVGAALPKLTKSRAYVSPETNGWTTVYLEATEDQNDETMRTIAGGLSKALKADVLGFLVHDSDIAAYWLYRKGTLTDEFNSAPDYFGETVDDKTRERVIGNTDALLPLCVAGTTRAQLDDVLHPADGAPMMAEDLVTDLAKLLGIDESRISLGLEYFDEEGEELLPDASQFLPVGKGALPKRQKSGPPAGAPASCILDRFSLEFSVTVAMLTKCWVPETAKMAGAHSRILPGMDSKIFLKNLLTGFDKGARGFLKKAELPGCPTFEELKAARDEGPDALAKLLIKRTPTELGSIATDAIQYKIEAFVDALLANGMDPNTPNQHGQSLLSVAENRGTPAIYELIKTALAKGK
jgi:hypothetical protein